MLKYQQIARDIENKIYGNNMIQGDQLPVLDTLTKQYDVSKNTIIKALNVLETNGIIYQVRGSGIFVRGKYREDYINLIEAQGFRSELSHVEITSKLLALESTHPSAEIAKQMQISESDEVYYVKRLRFVKDFPHFIEESYYDKKYVTYLNEQIAAGSIFKYLSEGLKLNISFADIYLHVVELNDTNTKLFQLDQPRPTIQTNGVYHLSDGTVFDYASLTFHPDKSNLFVQTNVY